MYFEKEGPANTARTVELALAAARERGAASLVVASTTGATARLLAGVRDVRVVCVTHAWGFAEKGANEFPDALRAELQAAGMVVYSGTHALSGAERGISRKFNGAYPIEMIAHSLRMLGQGIKVCVEIAVMALDAGLIPFGKPVVALAGTGRGADTAVLLTPAHANAIFETRIHEILCKPI